MCYEETPETTKNIEALAESLRKRRYLGLPGQPFEIPGCTHRKAVSIVRFVLWAWDRKLMANSRSSSVGEQPKPDLILDCRGRLVKRRQRSLESLLDETMGLLVRVGQGTNWESGASPELLEFLYKVRR